MRGLVDPTMKGLMDLTMKGLLDLAMKGLLDLAMKGLMDLAMRGLEVELGHSQMQVDVSSRKSPVIFSIFSNL